MSIVVDAIVMWPHNKADCLWVDTYLKLCMLLKLRTIVDYATWKFLELKIVFQLSGADLSVDRGY